MHQLIYVPEFEEKTGVTVYDVLVKPSDRVRSQQKLMHLSTARGLIPIVSQQNGWVTEVFVVKNQCAKPGSSLLLLDVIDVTEYRSNGELDARTEFGAKGRRALEREGALQFAAFARELAEPHETLDHEITSRKQTPLKEHPIVGKGKEGVPPRMSKQTTRGCDGEALLNPKLRLEPQLKAKLTKQLQIQPRPSPTLTRG